jgi:heme exporter protein A
VTLLRFDNVALVRGGRLLFEKIDFELRPGDALQIAGPNGAGKSSLLRLAAGLLAPSAGTIERAALALADDKLALDRDRSLSEALAFWAGRDPHSALRAMGIAGLSRVPVRFLSSGQAKRATLARVLASGAPLWLLDEPLNALDADGTDQLASAIRAHRANGGAVLAASHVPLSGEWARIEVGA